MLFKLYLVPFSSRTDEHLTKEIRFGRYVQKGFLGGCLCPRSPVDVIQQRHMDRTQASLRKHNLYCELSGGFAFSSCFFEEKRIDVGRRCQCL
jgi:hypothetical protein